MPEEPKQEMDQLLRAYAQKRREQAGEPFELHPVSRQQLNAHAAKVYGKSAEGVRKAAGMREFWAALWPRFAVGVGLSAALVALIYVLQPRGEHVAELALAKTPEVARREITVGGNANYAYGISKSRGLPVKSVQPETSMPASPPPAAAMQPVVTPPQPSLDPELDRAAYYADVSRREETNTNRPIALAARQASVHSKAASVTNRVISADSAISGELAAAKAITPAKPQEWFGDLQTLESKPEAASGLPPVSRSWDLKKGDSAASAPASSASEVAKQTLAEAEMPGKIAMKMAPSPADGDKVSDSTIKAKENVGQKVMETTASAESVIGRFVQVDNRRYYRSNLLSPPMPRVFSEFKVLRDGDRIRVVDADGSVYAGKSDAGSNGVFEVKGMSESLKKNIVFNGVILTNGQVLIKGRAKVGADVEFPIEATTQDR